MDAIACLEGAGAISTVPWGLRKAFESEWMKKRYENNRDRWLLDLRRTAPSDYRLVKLSLAVDDVLDVIGLIPAVNQVTVRRLAARTLQATYAVVRLNEALLALQRASKSTDQMFRFDTLSSMDEAELLGEELPREAPAPSWMDKILSSRNQLLIQGSLGSMGRLFGAMGGQYQAGVNVMMALYEVQEAISGDGTRAERYMVFHAAKLLEFSSEVMTSIQLKVKEQLKPYLGLSGTEFNALSNMPVIGSIKLQQLKQRARRLR